MKAIVTWSALCALLLLTALPASSQAVNATLLGTVTDASGAVVPSAKVTLANTDTGNSRVDSTNASGNYTFADIAPGNYSVTVEAAGFKKDMHSNLAVTVNTSTRVDVQLQPGDVTSTVEVTAAPPALQTDRADVSSQISTAQTANLPVGDESKFPEPAEPCSGDDARDISTLDVLQCAGFAADGGQRAVADGEQLSDRRNRR